MNLLALPLRSEVELADARTRARHIAELLGLGNQDQVRVATVVSELARNVLLYAGSGQVTFSVRDEAGRSTLLIEVRDQGPGLGHLDEVLGSQYRSKTGMGVGLTGTRRLMDEFDIQTAPGKGTVVRVGKHLPAVVGDAEQRRVAEVLGSSGPRDLLTALSVQNRDLLETLAALSEREERLQVLNQELQDTNRGVVALYAELEEKAERLREANGLKTTFLSYMSHELRTPLHSMLGLARILSGQLDGPLNPEQLKQVQLLQGAAGDLLEMVNGLLDLAKMEAGKTDVDVTTFEVRELFGTLRALFLPLLDNPAVNLIFEDAAGFPPLTTDQRKVEQVLRNFIANALKFTAAGEVRVTAQLLPSGDRVRFTVQDTGIGLSDEEQAQLFQDFSQVGRPGRPAGTGLGLSIARKFTELLGGRVGVQSAPGAGAEFSAELPVVYPGVGAAKRPRALLIDDSEADRYVLTTLLTRAGYEVDEVAYAEPGLEQARSGAYDAVVLDLNLPDRSGLDVLRALRENAETRSLPVLVVTAAALDAAERAALETLGASVHLKEALYQDEQVLLASFPSGSVHYGEAPDA